MDGGIYAVEKIKKRKVLTNENKYVILNKIDKNACLGCLEVAKKVGRAYKWLYLC